MEGSSTYPNYVPKVVSNKNPFQPQQNFDNPFRRKQITENRSQFRPKFLQKPSSTFEAVQTISPQTIPPPVPTPYSTERQPAETSSTQIFHPTRLPQREKIPVRIGSSNDECGVPDYKTPIAGGLIVGGQTAVRGQYPW